MLDEPIWDASPYSTPSQRQPDNPLTTLSFGWRVLLSLVIGLVQAVCFPPVGWVLLLPLCAAGFLTLITGVTLKSAFRIGFLYGLAWFLGDLYWFANIFGPAAVSLCAILALFTGLFAALYCWLNSRLPRIPDWLLAAIVWTGIEYFRSELFILKFGWLGLGYGVVNAPALVTGASWLGCYGLTFAIVAVAALLADGFQREDLRVTLRGCGIYCIWVLLTLIPLPALPPAHPLRVRLVQANSEDDESLFSLSRASAASPVDVIVWPEYSFVSDPTRQPKIWARLTNVARDNHSYFVFGAKDEFNPADPADYWNTAFLIGPDGKLAGKHVKNHTVHFFRDGVPGTQARSIPTAIGRLGIAICFDMDYPDVARRLVEDGAEVFLVPNDDPPEWGPAPRAQHRLMFQMRAVECGRWLARADVAGGTSVALPTGAEFARIRTTKPAKLEASVGRNTSRTLFVRGGWRFGPSCFVMLIGLCGWAMIVAYSSKHRAG